MGRLARARPWQPALPTRPLLYLTLIFDRLSRRLYRGAGGRELMARVESRRVPSDFAATSRGVVWAVGSAGERAGFVDRLSMPELEAESVRWDGRRLGAIACSADGRRAVVTDLPSAAGESVELRVWEEGIWSTVACRPAPDISSRLAWLDGARVAFESSERRLAIIDLASGQVDEGPPARCPAAAPGRGEWYALASGFVLRFPFRHPFGRPQDVVPLGGSRERDGLRVSDDGRFFAWQEPALGMRRRGYVADLSGGVRRLRGLDTGLGGVLGPYELK
jgi:hypothetical protein